MSVGERILVINEHKFGVYISSQYERLLSHLENYVLRCFITAYT
jgi:membrane-bound acyltransferase YfiQ involved in biofilm formation